MYTFDSVMRMLSARGPKLTERDRSVRYIGSISIRRQGQGRPAKRLYFESRLNRESPFLTGHRDSRSKFSLKSLAPRIGAMK